MILICEKCKASFLVPASLFMNGPRKVRCGRCAFEWKASKADGKDHPDAPPLPKAKGSAPTEKSETKPQAPTSKPFPSSDVRQAAEVPPLSDKAAAADKDIWASLDAMAKNFPTEPPKPEEPKEEEKQVIPKGPSKLALLLQLLRSIPFGKIIKMASYALAGFIVFALILLLTCRTYVLNEWPFMCSAYSAIGLMPQTEPEKLVLRNITSERRYMDGAMHLVVSGGVYSQAEETLYVPDILVEAIGPNKKVIQSWHIKPDKGTLKAKQHFSFFSAIISPEENIIEVNLSFVEPPHEPD